MNDYAKYEQIKEEILRLCDIFNIPKPIINKNRIEDICDVTNPPFIRIKVVKDILFDYHARHVLGHYIADLHLIDADCTADLIANILKEKE